MSEDQNPSSDRLDRVDEALAEAGALIDAGTTGALRHLHDALAVLSAEVRDLRGHQPRKPSRSVGSPGPIGIPRDPNEPDIGNME